MNEQVTEIRLDDDVKILLSPSTTENGAYYSTIIIEEERYAIFSGYSLSKVREYALEHTPKVLEELTEKFPGYFEGVLENVCVAILEYQMGLK